MIGYGVKNNMSDLISSELMVIKHFINDGDIVFDLGGFQGEWTQAVLNSKSKCSVHIFEPVTSSYEKIKVNLSEFIKRGTVMPNQCCVSNDSGLSHFWIYEENTVLSTLHKRNENELKRVGISPIVKRDTAVKITLDEYCKLKNIEYIDFLKIDVEGDEFNVLKGASDLLSKKRIKYIQFEYGGCYVDSNTKLEEVFLYLKEKGYMIGKISYERVDFVHQFLSEMEDYGYCNYLGVLEDIDMFQIQFRREIR